MAVTDGQAGSAKGTKRRAACDTCRVKKLKCNGEQPVCGRCEREQMQCVYSAQAPMGRPRKRQRSEEDQDSVPSGGNAVEVEGAIQAGQDPFNTGSSDMASFNTTTIPAFDMDAFDMAFATEANTQPWMFPQISGDTNIARLEDLPSLTNASSANSDSPPMKDPTQAIGAANSHLDMSHNDSSLPTCACLSTMYLTLNELTTQAADPTFPAALQPLRNAMQTAQTVLTCEICPKRFLTGLHNVQLLGILLVSIASTIQRTLQSIRSETADLISTNRTKPFSLTALTPGPATPQNSFTLSLPPSQYASLALSAVKSEVYGPSPSCPSTSTGEDFPPQLFFMSLITQMEQRQHRFHSRCHDGQDHMPEGFPAGFGSEAGQEGQGGEPLCLKLVYGARKMVEGFSWEGT